MHVADQALSHVKNKPLGAEERFLFPDVSWHAYTTLADQTLSHRRVRITFAHDQLELMRLSRLHEVFRWLLGQSVFVLAEEFNLPLAVGGSMTLRREDLRLGIEPDECYWIQHAAQVHGRAELDFQRDPPPDLAVEIEVSRGIINRLGIYAALWIPEVWRFDGNVLQSGQLQLDGQYRWGDTSATFPGLPLAEVARFLREWHNTPDQLSIVRSFRAWVREQFQQQKGG